MSAPDPAAAPVVHTRLRALALINMAAGLWLITTPFLLRLPRAYPHQLAFLSLVLTGTLVLSLSVVHALQWSRFRRASWGNVFLGCWLVTSPVLIGFTKYLSNGKTVAAVCVLTGLVVVAGGALCLAGSETEVAKPRPPIPGPEPDMPAASGARPTAGPTIAGPALPRPALWPVTRAGEQPVAFRGRADERDHDAAAARGKLPLAWTAVAGLITAAVLFGVALVLRSPALGICGAVLGLAAFGLARKVRILSDVSVGQSPTGR